MKIFSRYLLLRLVQPFLICLAACSVIWIMVDLYSNIDVFIENRVALHKILYFYSLQLPQMLVTILPATLLFSSLFTLLNLNRRSELVALQAGGISPLRLFLPFLLFSAVLTLILWADMAAPAPWAESTRARILKQVKGDNAGRDEFDDLPYVDNTTHTVWMLQKININSGKAEGVDILMRDGEKRDRVEYCARSATWDAEHSNWRLRDVRVLRYNLDGDKTDVQDLALKDLTDLNTPPQQLINSTPEELNLRQLGDYIQTNNLSEKHLAAYRTEWWQRTFHPFSLIVFMLFALANGVTTDRRHAVAGVFNSIAVLVLYLLSMYIFLSAGQANRFPAVLAAGSTPILFGAVGLYYLAKNNGWLWVWWRLIGKTWDHFTIKAEPPAEPAT